ncbi:MAG: hypothetical protein KC486_12810 [Myxococcales bacterium]|nr:hypothetical protein [Myxococcales bacterium]
MDGPRLLVLGALALGCSAHRAPEVEPRPQARAELEAEATAGSIEAAQAEAATAVDEPEAPQIPTKGAAAGELVALAPGVHHTCALFGGGEVRCWGLNRFGILGVGDSTSESILTPTPVVGLPPAVQVVADYDYTCALAEAGAVYCWGENDGGRLGDGGGDRKAAPTEVAGVVADRIFAGFHRACAAKGTRYQCWGSGEFGDGQERRESRSVDAAALKGSRDLALSDGHACVLRRGQVRCWGHNGSGQLGNGEGGCRYERELCPSSRCLPPQECKSSATPVRAIDLPKVAAIAVGGSHSYARAADGSIWRWGQTGTTMDFGEANPRYRPSRFDEVPALVEIAAGGSHACGRTEEGALYCWGNNAFGQLGHPPDLRGGSEGAAKVEGLPPVTGVALGFYFSCAIAGEGAAAEAYCWGDNGWGQLGDGTTERRHAPVRVALR